jgi:hypothetical protein
MKFKKALSILLVLSLLLAVIGITSSKTFCKETQEVVSGKCCKDMSKKDQNCCINLVFNYKMQTDLSTSDASISLPEVSYVTITLLKRFLIPESVLDNQHSQFIFKSPLITEDYSVLNQVFRI